jgi:sugar/nucleoside kinase (ribokinase family)
MEKAENTSRDFIAVGDTVIDAFIRLEVGHVLETASGPELCIPYGEKVPFESVTIVPAVGNSANAAVSASRLGITSALVSFLGDDKNGEDCLARLKEENVDTQFMSVQKDLPTNYHYVLWYGDDRTILIKHAPFTAKLPDIGNPKWIYISSLGEHARDIHFEIAEYKKSHPETKIAFQPGTFQLKMKRDLDELYKVTDVVCMNKEEAQGLLDSEEHEIKPLLNGLEALGPHTMIITDGHAGAYMKADNTYFNMPIYPDTAPPVDRTGAGDAFFSTFVTYLVKGYDAAYAITRAPINSMSVVQHIGAQEGLLIEETIEDYLKKAPGSYKLSILE